MILITLFLLILYFENVKEKIKSFSPEDFKKTLRLEELQFPSLELPKLEKFQIPTELQIPREFQVPK